MTEPHYQTINTVKSASLMTFTNTHSRKWTPNPICVMKLFISLRAKCDYFFSNVTGRVREDLLHWSECEADIELIFHPVRWTRVRIKHHITPPIHLRRVQTSAGLHEKNIQLLTVQSDPWFNVKTSWSLRKGNKHGLKVFLLNTATWCVKDDFFFILKMGHKLYFCLVFYKSKINSFKIIYLRSQMNEVIKSCLWKSIQIKWLSLCLDRSINQSIKKN